jgi:hypothetical protein
VWAAPPIVGGVILAVVVSDGSATGSLLSVEGLGDVFVEWAARAENFDQHSK